VYTLEKYSVKRMYAVGPAFKNWRSLPQERMVLQYFSGPVVTDFSFFIKFLNRHIVINILLVIS